MEDILYCKDLYEPLELKGVKPADKSEADWKKMNRKTIGHIRQWIDQSVFHHVSQETDANSLWTTLESMYEKKNAQNKTFVIRKIVNLKYRDGSSVSEHMSEFQGLVNQLSTMKLNLDDEIQALLLLSSLPNSWETLVVSLSNSAPEGKISMQMVKDSIHNEETRRKEQGMNFETQALVAENRGRSNFKESHKGKPHHSKSRNHRSKSKTRDGGTFRCFHCNKEGHYKRNCKIWLEKQKTGEQGKVEDKNTAATITEDVVILSFGEEECLHVDDQKIDWVIDTGASYHATPKKEFFMTYKAGDFGHVRMGNTDRSKIIGIGDVCIQTDVGCTITLRDVRHVPDLRLNLISGMALDREGYDNHFGGGKWKLTKGAMVVARGVACCSLYKTHVKMCSSELNAVEGESSPNLWHKRLGHMSEKGLQMLAKRSLIPFAKGTNLSPCDYCLFGKQNRVSFSSSAKRKSKILEIVHSDVCGPMEVESLGGNRYFATFIDDASRKV